MKRRIAAGLLAASLALPALAEDAPGRPTMTVSATGSVSAAPDQARIAVGVEGVATEAREAMALNNTRMATVFETLDAFGISAENISTTGVSLDPRYDHSSSSRTPRITGYTVANQVDVTVDEIDRLGRALDGLVDAGVNSIRSVSFSVADTASLRAEARKEAARLARTKAEDYAGALGTGIRGVLKLSENGGARPVAMPRRGMALRAKGTPVPVSPSEVDVEIRLTAVFLLTGTLE